MDQRPLILIVDDEISVRHTLEALLAKEAYDLAFASTGKEALAMLENIEPDVILLDVMLPVMDGFEVCKRLKTDEGGRSGIPVILITALESKEAMSLGFEAGADDFLTKPMSGLELRARVRSMLRMKRQNDALARCQRLPREIASMLAGELQPRLTDVGDSLELLRGFVTESSARRALEDTADNLRHAEAAIKALSKLVEQEEG